MFTLSNKTLAKRMDALLNLGIGIQHGQMQRYIEANKATKDQLLELEIYSDGQVVNLLNKIHIADAIIGEFINLDQIASLTASQLNALHQLQEDKGFCSLSIPEKGEQLKIRISGYLTQNNNQISARLRVNSSALSFFPPGLVPLIASYVDPSSMDQLSVDRSSMDQLSVDRSLMDQPSVDRSLMDQPSVDRSSMDQPSVDRSLMDQPSVVRCLMDQPSLYPSLMDQPTITEPTNSVAPAASREVLSFRR